MKISTKCLENGLIKEITYKIGRKKQFQYYKCDDLIICRDLTDKKKPAISIYPGFKTMLGRFKKLNESKKNLLNWEDFFKYT